MSEQAAMIILAAAAIITLTVTVMAPIIAHSKGRPWPLWLLYALILPGISLVHAWLLKPRAEDTTEDRGIDHEPDLA